MTVDPKLLLMLVTGVGTGIFAGVSGVGGGAILVPALVFLFGFSQQAAAGTSLVALLLPVGLFGAYEYHRRGFLTTDHVKWGLIISVGMFLGAYLGAKIGSTLPQENLKKAFSFVLFGIAIRLWFP